MKTIIAIHLLNNFSGSPRVLATALDCLEEQGHDVHLYTSKGPGFLDGKGTIFFDVPYTWHPNKWLRLCLYTFSQIILCLRLLKYWRQDVQFFINTMLPFGAAVAAKLMGKAVVYYCHETHIDPPLLNRWLRFWIKHSADRLIMVSEYVKEELALEPIPMVTIPNIIDGELLEDSQHAPLPQPTGNILMAASLKKSKGIFEFIGLAEKMPNMAFKLVLGASAEEVSAFLEERKLPRNLILLARQADMRPHYRSAALLLNLSIPGQFHETLGMTILEGMAYGLPVIVPPAGAPRYWVTEGKEGYQIDSRDTDALVECIEAMLSDKKLYQQLSQQAQRTANTFSQKHFEEQLSQLFSYQS